MKSEIGLIQLVGIMLIGICIVVISIHKQIAHLNIILLCLPVILYFAGERVDK